jgi:SAM-dependent methyltransferase
MHGYRYAEKWRESDKGNDGEVTLRHQARALENKVSSLIFRLRTTRAESFECPVCGYRGPFMDVHPSTGRRRHAKCPTCGAAERHRLQFLVLKDILGALDASGLRMLHFAPEPLFRELFRTRFGKYETADLSMRGVDHNVDLQQLPFDSETFDFVFASHVLEHVPDDERAISEIRRILKPNGVAVLPVPIVAEVTVEYPGPNAQEAFHVRAPGRDYFKRYERHFSSVEIITSASHPQKYQLYVYEDRTNLPNKRYPLRPPMQGERHLDFVPVCYV